MSPDFAKILKLWISKNENMFAIFSKIGKRASFSLGFSILLFFRGETAEISTRLGNQPLFFITISTKISYHLEMKLGILKNSFDNCLLKKFLRNMCMPRIKLEKKIDEHVINFSFHFRFFSSLGVRIYHLDAAWFFVCIVKIFHENGFIFAFWSIFPLLRNYASKFVYAKNKNWGKKTHEHQTNFNSHFRFISSLGVRIYHLDAAWFFVYIVKIFNENGLFSAFSSNFLLCVAN